MSEIKNDERNIVLGMLNETLEKGVFSHIAVNDAFSKEKLSGPERAFISRLYHGVLERLIYLDFCLNKVSKVNTAKMRPAVLNILRMGTYQLFFMDSVPDRAAVNESAVLARKKGFKELVPFVNGVLRTLAREGKEAFEKEMPENVLLSVPKWMYMNAKDTFGQEAAELFFKGTLSENEGITVKLNTAKDSEENIVRFIRSENVRLEAVSELGGVYKMSPSAPLNRLDSYKKGLFWVQDESSIRAAISGCSELEKITDEPLIIDVCAAPGGKSMCAAGYFPDGKIISRDLSEGKVKLINENISRLGIKNMNAEVHDALVFDSAMEGKADMVIADLPCSGLGCIGGKPDIKFRVKEKDLVSLARLQQDILDVVQKYVKAGGILVYSTCTFDKKENDDNVDAFLKEHSFECISRKSIFERGKDGFYIAVLKKING